MLKVFFDPLYEQHNTGFGHPERGARLEAFVEGLEAGGVSRASFTKPSPASLSAIAAVHPQSYIDIVQRVCDLVPAGQVGELPTGDTIIAHDSFAIALAAAGGAVAAVNAGNYDDPAIAVIRPPGHHAEPRRGMGFCVFNNIAIAAAGALQRGHRVLIVDFDYHHGNGTQAWVESALEQGARGLGFISTHAYPAYPGTGAFNESSLSEAGFVIDIPLPHSTDTADFIGVWSSLLPPVAQRLKPTIILASAGFDFLAGDPIAGLPIAPRAVDALCGLLGNIANQHQAGLALVLEGGYSLDNLRKSGSSLAYDFGKHSIDVAVPQASAPREERLRSMVEQVQRWL